MLLEILQEIIDDEDEPSVGDITNQVQDLLENLDVEIETDAAPVGSVTWGSIQEIKSAYDDSVIKGGKVKVDASADGGTVAVLSYFNPTSTGNDHLTMYRWDTDTTSYIKQERIVTEYITSELGDVSVSGDGTTVAIGLANGPTDTYDHGVVLAVS